MKTIFKILSLVMIIMISSCDRPLEDTDFLDDRTPYVGFQKSGETVVLNEGIDLTYDVVVDISSTTLDSPVDYMITYGADSTIEEGDEFTVDCTYTIAPGSPNGIFSITFSFDDLDPGVSQLILNLDAEGDVQMGTVLEFSINVVKIP